MHGLQIRAACAEQGQDRRLSRHVRKSVEERIVRAEDHAGSEDRNAVKRTLDCKAPVLCTTS